MSWLTPTIISAGSKISRVLGTGIGNTNTEEFWSVKCLFII